MTCHVTEGRFFCYNGRTVPQLSLNPSGGVLCGAGGSDAAGYQNLSEGIAAQTVAAVDATRHLACGIEAGDRLAAGIEHMALFIHHQSAHGMVGGRCQCSDGEQS